MEASVIKEHVSALPLFFCSFRCLLRAANGSKSPSQHSCNLSILQSTMAKISGKICSSHCSKVTCPVPVLLTSHPLLRHGLSLGEVKEKGVEDEGEGGYGLASSSLSPALLTCSCFFLCDFLPRHMGYKKEN